MADASFNQTSFLGGQWSPSAHGRIELPVYRTALATSLNGLPIEEGAWTGRSGTRDLGLTSSSASGQIKEFWLPNNQAAILELTPSLLRVWVMDRTAGYRALTATYSTNYNTVAKCQSVQIIQADGVAFFLLETATTFVLTCTNFSIAGLGVDPLFTFAHVVFNNTDGPYLDPLPGNSQTNNSLGEVSDFHFETTFTITDGAYSFVSSDGNRGIRLWSQPPAWDSTASYAIGAAVSFGGTYWTALVGGALQVGVQPGAVTQPPSGSSSVPTQAWFLSPQLGVWAYGKITAVLSSDQVSITLLSSNAIPTKINGLVIDTWQLGLYTGNVFPSCGVFHAGRVMFSGAVPGRYDFSVANGTNPLMFSPTDEFGNVLDDSGISYTLTLTPVSSALWAISDHGGIVVGSAAGEVLITASTLNDPLTPTSVDARWASHYKGAAIEPVRMGIGIGFVQSFGRRLEEYVVDVFSQKFIGRHLNEFSKGLTTSGIKKIVYQEEIAPVIWCVTNNGTLLGCTYRRVSNFGTEGPLFSAWHTHTLGSGRTVEWACLGTTTRGTEDVLILLTFDGRDRRLEMMQPLFDDGQTLQQAWPLDSAFSSGTLSGTDNDGDTITISGLPTHFGVTNYSVWLAGLYCGVYPVIKPSGTIQVPYGSDPDGLLTAQWLRSHTGSTYGVAFSVAGSNVVVPCVVGFPFTQTIKLLRPATVEDVRTQTGPGLAKTRRSHMYGLLVANSVTGALISVDNGPTAPISFVGPDQQTKIDHATLYSGVHWDTLDDDYTFDGQIVIQQPLPYPLTVAAVTGFIHTQDR